MKTDEMPTMPTDPNPSIVRNYLADVDMALTSMDPTTHAEILAGIRGELIGLTPEQAAIRMEALGDPTFIAAEARAEAGWYVVIATLSIMIGGVLVPIVGAVFGYLMVWTSSFWRRRDKWLATLFPIVLASAVCLVSALPWLFSFSQTDIGDSLNPQLPIGHFALWNALVTLLPAMLVAGGWLLWRVRGAR